MSAVPISNGHEEEVRNLEQLLDVSTKVLEQALDLLDNTLTSDEQLTVSSKFLPGSTIGMLLFPSSAFLHRITVVQANTFVMLEIISPCSSTACPRHPHTSLPMTRDPGTPLWNLVVNLPKKPSKKQ